MRHCQTFPQWAYCSNVLTGRADGVPGFPHQCHNSVLRPCDFVINRNHLCVTFPLPQVSQAIIHTHHYKIIIVIRPYSTRGQILLFSMLIMRRRQWQPTPVLLPGKSHGRRSLVGCSPWGREESDTTERLHFHFSLSCIGEGDGNPLQCSCLENPRDRGAWWAAISRVAQNQTRLKRLSSSMLIMKHI